MKNSFFVIIYLVVFGIIVILQSIKINKLNIKIKDEDRLKKEIYKLGDQISIIETKQEVYDFILNTAIKLFGKGNSGSIIIQEEDGLFYYKSIRGFDKIIKNEVLRKEQLSLYKYNACKDIAILNSEENTGSILSAPINYDGKLIGVINIFCFENYMQFNDDDIRTMRYIRHELELAIKNFLIQDRLKHIATHDELTNLYNRRYFNELYEKEIENVKANRVKSYLAIIDLDDFKEINDTYGHAMGDKALMRMAHAMNISLDENDTYARISGDEFVIIFRDITYEDIVEKLTKIRNCLKVIDDEIRVDFTYGVVSISENYRLEKDEIISIADRDMYKEKRKKKVGR